MKRRDADRCRICEHVERTRIELLIASGASIRSVARKFGTHYQMTWRHWRHVPAERKAWLIVGPVQKAALAARISEESSSVVDNLKAVRAGLWSLYDAAVEAGDRNGGALLAGKLIEACRTMGKITGEIAQSPLVTSNVQNIFVSPAFGEVQAALIAVLARHPAARADVLAMFRELESRAAPPPMLEVHETSTAA